MKRYLPLLLLLFVGPTQAANSVFLAPASAGGNTGVDCANPKAATYFNSGANYSATPSGIQIGPDTTVHLCSGTYTGTLNTNLLAFQGDGTTGHPITLLFDSGAVVTSPAYGRLGNAGIVSFGHSHIVINLGTNGVIQATANGGGLANQLAGNAIYIFSASDVVIQNGTIANVCQHQQGVNNSGCSTSGSDDAAIFIDSSSTVTVQNVAIHDAMAAIFHNPGTNDQDDHYLSNTITNCNWGIAIGAANTGNVATRPVVAFNDISNAVKWDEPGNRYHHNGSFNYVGQGTGHIDNLVINSNYIHGDIGLNDTSYIFLDPNTGSINNPIIINNVLASTSSHAPANAFITGIGQTGGIIANNTVSGNSINTGEGCIADNFGASGATIKNNICTLVSTYIWLNDPSTISASNFNDFFGGVSSTKFKNQAATYTSLAQWTSALGFDANSITTDPQLSGTWVPNALSPVVNTGTNLTSLGIAALNVDKNGVARPSSGNWTMGAFVVGGAPVGAVPSTLFGMELVYQGDAPTIPYGAMGKGTLTKWVYIEQTKNVFVWTNLDYWVTTANAAGVPFTWAYEMAPPWAAGTCNLASDGVSQECSGNVTDLAGFHTFMLALVSRYDGAHGHGRIDYYELYNEPETFFTGSMANLVSLTVQMYNDVKATDPTAKVLGIGMTFPDTYFASGGYMDQYWAAGGVKTLDAVSFHGYPHHFADVPEIVNTFVPFVTAAMARNGVSSSIPIWDTEGSWGDGGSGWNPTSDEQIGWPARSYLLHWSNSVVRLDWYAWGNTVWGPLKNSGGILPAGTAYGQIYNWMVGETMNVPCSASGTVWTCGLIKLGRQTLAVWDTNGNSTYTAASQYTQYKDLTGTTNAIPGTHLVTIGVKPILLVTGSSPGPPPVLLSVVIQ